MATSIAGYKTFMLNDLSRKRPILVDLWYPAHKNSVAGHVDYNPGYGFAARNAAYSDSSVPIILLSHGAFGAARNYSWIAEYLAGEGYMVAGISHFGESFIYGPETIDPLSVLNPQLRTEDCSFVLNNLIDGSELSGLADISRIGAIGHSSGGATVLELAGAVFSSDDMLKYCLSEASKEDMGCHYARQLKLNSETHVSWSGKDERVKVVVALDPAMGPGHTSESLAAVKLPVFIIGSTQNDFLPYNTHAGRYARLIPDAKVHELNSGEGHFIFLNKSNSTAEANGVPLYQDREGISREAIHERLKEKILLFYNRYFKS